MQVRCPNCRRVTAIPPELLEYLARCDRCGAMLHIRASAVKTSTIQTSHGVKAGRRRNHVVAKVVPRPVAVQSDRMSSGIFDLPRMERYSARPEERSATMTAERPPMQRPARPPAPRNRSGRVLGFVAFGMLGILALLVMEIIYAHLRG